MAQCLEISGPPLAVCDRYYTKYYATGKHINSTQVDLHALIFESAKSPRTCMLHLGQTNYKHYK